MKTNSELKFISSFLKIQLSLKFIGYFQRGKEFVESGINRKVSSEHREIIPPSSPTEIASETVKRPYFDTLFSENSVFL
jgi:hypothetical protein